MSTADAAATANGPLAAGLKASNAVLSKNQAVTFTLYKRVVLPLDGFVFWVRAETLSESALFNSMSMNRSYLNRPPLVSGAAKYITVSGSLHNATDQRQEEDATYAVNRMIFTSDRRVNDFDEIGPDELYIANFRGIRFAFSARGSYYVQADLHHYVGDAIYSWMASQVVDDPRTLNTKQLVVSNSLPAWLALNQYAPAYPVPLPQPMFQLYPSFLSPNNLPPIYGTVHIAPEGTSAIGAAPVLSRNLSHSQLARDQVSITLYGVGNDLAQTFLDSVIQYTLDTAAFGISNMPIMMDDKRVQSELGTLAMKKTIRFDVNYYQTSMRRVARQLIESAFVTVYPQADLRSFETVPIIIT